MRINKFISESGLCSRREADALVAAGRVTVNGRPAEPGTPVAGGDDVRVDGQPVGAKKKHVYIALNKPVGVTCTTDTRDPTNIVEYIGHEERIFPVGRLDKDSDGLILLTNNGDIVNDILRAANHHEKEYLVSVDKPVTPEFVDGMAGGVPILGQMTRRCRVQKVDRHTFRIVLTQGLNRQIRRMCEHFGYEVQRLTRVRIMNIRLGNLKQGQWRNLRDDELEGLLPDRNLAALRRGEDSPDPAHAGDRPAPGQKSPAPGTPAAAAPTRSRRPAPRPPASRPAPPARTPPGRPPAGDRRRPPRPGP